MSVNFYTRTRGEEEGWGGVRGRDGEKKGEINGRQTQCEAGWKRKSQGAGGTKLDQGQGSKKTKQVTSPHSIPSFLFEPHNF